MKNSDIDGADFPSRSLLAVDIGGGTQDILLWQPGRTMENALKMIMPSPTVILARRIDQCRSEKKPICLTGVTMGGGPITKAIMRHLEAKLDVFSLPEAATTIHDDIQRVKDMGIRIVDQPPPKVTLITTQDLDMVRIRQAFHVFGVSVPDRIAVAVQDHGFSPKESNRIVRFRFWKNLLDEGHDLRHWVTQPPSQTMTRMGAVAKTHPGCLVLDTGLAAILGALLDPRGQAWQHDGLCAVNVGNFHTVAALVHKARIYGIYEHHTGLLTPSKLHDHLHRFAIGSLSHEEVFNDNGHGCAYSKAPRPSRFQNLLVTGPRRRTLFSQSDSFASPYGDMMLTGCFGLVQAAGWRESMHNATG